MPNYEQPLSPFVRAKRAAETQSIHECDRDSFLLWAFCPWCAHCSLHSPRLLVALVKDPPNLLDELERRLRCNSCGRHGVKLVPSDRTEISFDPMGAHEKNTSERCSCGWYATRRHEGDMYCARCFEKNVGIKT